MITVRRAEEKDIVEIQKIAIKAWHDTYHNIMAASTIVQFLNASYSEERLEKRLKESVFLVAEDEGEIVGFASFINGTELYLSAIYVMPGHQRKSTGQLLLQEGLKICEGYREIFVEVATDNLKAKSFYEKQGFELVRQYEEELFGEKVMTGLFKKALGE